MAEIKEFVVNDRRKFTAEGELRPDAPTQPAAESPKPVPIAPRTPPTPAEAAPVASTPTEPEVGDQAPQPPTAEQSHQAASAYVATVERLDTAIRATNPGMERMPEMNFAGLIQRLYIEALFQLGGVTQPDQQPRVDLLGARQTIDMLAVLADKTADNLSADEDALLRSALFELRMGFLELTQAIARQAAQQQQANPGGSGFPPPPGGGPSLIR